MKHCECAQVNEQLCSRTHHEKDRECEACSDEPKVARATFTFSIAMGSRLGETLQTLPPFPFPLPLTCFPHRSSRERQSLHPPSVQRGSASQPATVPLLLALALSSICTCICKHCNKKSGRKQQSRSQLCPNLVTRTHTSPLATRSRRLPRTSSRSSVRQERAAETTPGVCTQVVSKEFVSDAPRSFVSDDDEKIELFILFNFAFALARIPIKHLPSPM